MSEKDNELTLKNSERLSFNSVNELKKIQVLCFCGVMGAVAIVLGTVATIKVGDFLRIGFSSIPNQIIAYLFGPWVGAIFGGAMDIIKFFINPTGEFFPGYTLTAIVAGIIYGLFLYKRPVKLWRVIAAEACVKVFCNLGLNTLWVMMTTGNAFKAIMVPRIAANAGKLPADVIILMILLPVVNKVIKPALSINLKSFNKKKA
ncbi:folate family ECF transporter S component [Butyrivibrio sp. XPD2006]|uniref:folate family ECF transporter S component n=1 Tax=Butyrivibrio sp. XPD2006 TaxID=1280668 RepID=UPI0003B3CD80|nr:folate family ECF transporter S component [Butyrivibrio sp. XPD2006]